MTNIILILKGVLVGIGKIIPGVSGGMIAISLGIYEKAIYAFNNIFLEFKKNFKFLFFIGIGVVFSVIFMSNIILWLLEEYYFSTMLLFLGLIIGGFEDVKKEIYIKKRLIILLPVIFIFLFSYFGKIFDIGNSSSYFYYFISGILDAVTMVVPGVSGTAVLMIIGSYEPIIRAFSEFTQFYISLYNFSILLPYFIGLIIGAIITLKIINYLFKKFKNETYNAIYGFSLGTVIYMAIKCFFSNYSLLDFIIGIILFFIGYISIKKINSF